METPAVDPNTNSQIALWIGLFILGNGSAIGFCVKWAVNRAIDYTHLQRDVKELQDFKKEQIETNKKNEFDHKGLSIKIDNKTKEKP